MPESIRCSVCEKYKSSMKPSLWRVDKCNKCWAKIRRQENKSRKEDEKNGVPTTPRKAGGRPKTRVGEVKSIGAHVPKEIATLFMGLSEIVGGSKVGLLITMIEEKSAEVCEKQCITRDQILAAGHKQV